MKKNRSDFNQKIVDTGRHIELVFHRFLSGEDDLDKISITLNARQLEPFDPFHSQHTATIRRPEEIFKIKNHEIKIQPFTLPHHKKVSGEVWEHYAGPEGYIKNQGFYVYREKRLIIHGTWFNLARQTELTKLSRVRIDMSNGMDSDWKIDVKKSSAQLPSLVRDRLKRIIEEIGADSKQIYTKRGKRLVSDDRIPAWNRIQDKNSISYGLNPEHPVFESFMGKLPDEQKNEFLKLVCFSSMTLPLEAMHVDFASNNEMLCNIIDDQILEDQIKTTCFHLSKNGYSMQDIKSIMSSSDPFRSNWKISEEIIEYVNKEENSDG